MNPAAMQPPTQSKLLTVGAGWLAIAMGLTVLTGWLLDSSLLKSGWPGGVTVKANTALAFILLGVAFASPAFAILPDSQPAPVSRPLLAWFGRVAGFLAGVIGLVSFGEYLFDWNPGFDQWLFTEAAGAIGTTVPGRMAPETAACFMLLAAAVAATGTRRSPRWLLAAGALGGLSVSILAGAGLLTQFTPTLGAVGWWGQTAMAIPTAATFAMLGVAVTRAALCRVGPFWHLGRATTLAFCGGLVVLMLVNLSINRSQSQTLELNRQIRRHEQVSAGFLRILAETNRAQNHTRGFLLTGEPRLLAGQRTADATCRAALKAQQQLLAGNEASQWPTLAAKVTAALDWFQLMTTFTETRENVALRPQRVLLGEHMMEDFRQSLEQFVHANDHSRRDLEAAAAELAGRSFAIVALGTLLSAGVFMGAATGLNRAYQGRSLAHAALREANLLLERRVRDRTAEVARHQQLLEQAGELARMGAWEVDLIGQTLKWSAVVREIHEVDAAFVPTLEAGLNFYAPASVPLITAAVNRAITHGEPFDLELQLVGARGNRPWVRTMGKAVQEGGRVVRLFGMFQDITGRRQAVEQLQRKREQLEAANRELEAFAYSVSHDLRAPLRSIDGFSRILLEDYADKFDEEGRDSVNRIRAASQRMALLIDDLLNLSRVTRTEMRREPVDLSATARQVLAELQRQEPTRRVDLAIADGLATEGDPALLRIVLENLLGNAWKFTARRESARIEFGANRTDGTPGFFVRDNGAGFDPAYAGKLFGAFQRLHSAQEFSGTGIGLATAQRILHRHGGRIWAEGRVGAGATFYFILGPNRPATPQKP